MRKALALLGLALLLGGLLALIISGAAREVVVIPLLYLLWLMRVLVESLPQAALWGGFLAIAAIVAWRSLAVPRAAPPARQAALAARAPVAAWAEMFQRAAEDRYARWLLAQRLGQLMLELLASQDQRAAQGLWQYLHDDSPDLPPAVRAYLLAGTQLYRPARGWWRWWPYAAPAEPHSDPLDLDPAEVIAYFEQRLSRTTGAQL